MEVKHDEENRMAILTVQDSDVKQQKEMWGEFLSSSSTSKEHFC